MWSAAASNALHVRFTDRRPPEQHCTTNCVAQASPLCCRGRMPAPGPAVSSNLVLLQNVSKLYRLYRRPSDRLREMLPGVRPRHTDFWALRDIGFSVEKGETLSLVGPNGCGKSTLLQIVSGILQPTFGRVVTRGRIAALLEQIGRASCRERV